MVTIFSEALFLLNRSFEADFLYLLKTGTVGNDFLRLMLFGEPWLGRGQCPAKIKHHYILTIICLERWNSLSKDSFEMDNFAKEKMVSTGNPPHRKAEQMTTWLIHHLPVFLVTRRSSRQTAPMFEFSFALQPTYACSQSHVICQGKISWPPNKLWLFSFNILTSPPPAYLS